MHPDVRRELILAAALRVYARRGLGDTRHSDVAKEAALAVSTTFHYFPTKTALLTAVVNEVARFLLKDVVASHAHGKDSAPVAIERILMTFCDAMDSHPDHVRVWLEWSVSVRDEAWDARQTGRQRRCGTAHARCRAGHRRPRAHDRADEIVRQPAPGDRTHRAFAGTRLPRSGAAPSHALSR
jgi:TetR/AcrR family hemagglutinin/protease transcriptional regulator